MDDPQDLRYLHDAVLHSIEQAFSPEEREFRFTATFHEDTCLPRVDNQQVVVRARDVTLVVATVHGAVHGDETVDSFDFELPRKTRKQLARLAADGDRTPAIGFTLTTHSGSSWAVACETIEVKIGGDRNAAAKPGRPAK